MVGCINYRNANWNVNSYSRCKILEWDSGRCERDIESSWALMYAAKPYTSQPADKGIYIWNIEQSGFPLGLSSIRRSYITHTESLAFILNTHKARSCLIGWWSPMFRQEGAGHVWSTAEWGQQHLQGQNTLWTFLSHCLQAKGSGQLNPLPKDWGPSIIPRSALSEEHIHTVKGYSAVLLFEGMGTRHFPKYLFSSILDTTVTFLKFIFC